MTRSHRLLYDPHSTCEVRGGHPDACFYSVSHTLYRSCYRCEYPHLRTYERGTPIRYAYGEGYQCMICEILDGNLGFSYHFSDFSSYPLCIRYFSHQGVWSYAWSRYCPLPLYGYVGISYPYHCCISYSVWQKCSDICRTEKITLHYGIIFFKNSFI